MDGPPPSREAFAAEYRSLSTAERRAFIADLQEARGWETSSEAAVVVATQEGTVSRIAVGQPDPDVPIEIVVATDERLRSLADDRNADVLRPETLRDELFYALDRQEGTELFRRHFGNVDLEPAEATDRVDEGFSSRRDETSALFSVSRDRHTEAKRSGAAPGSRHTKADDRTAESDKDTAEPRDVIPIVLLFAAGVAFVLFLVFSSGYGAGALPDLLSTEEAVETSGTDPAGTNAPTEASDGSTTETETDTVVGSDGEKTDDGTTEDIQGLPPGLAFNSDHDIEQIAAAHVTAVESHESLRFRMQSEGPVNAGDIEAPDDLDVQIAANNQYLIEERNDGDTAEGNVSVDVFADGAYEYRRIDTPSGARYNRYSIPMESTVTGWTGEYGAHLVRTFLNTTDSDVVRTYLYTSKSTDDRNVTDDRTAYRITIESPPPALADEATSYQAAATVMSDGTVRTLTVSYEHEPTGEEVWLRFRYTIGEIDVDSPLWYDRAREEFDSIGTRPGV